MRPSASLIDLCLAQWNHTRCGKAFRLSVGRQSLCLSDTHFFTPKPGWIEKILFEQILTQMEALLVVKQGSLVCTKPSLLLRERGTLFHLNPRRLD